MKTYKFEIIVTEGYDEFWEELKESGRSGCDEVMDGLREMLRDNPQFDATISLVEYTDKG